MRAHAHPIAPATRQKKSSVVQITKQTKNITTKANINSGTPKTRVVEKTTQVNRVCLCTYHEREAELGDAKGRRGLDVEVGMRRQLEEAGPLHLGTPPKDGGFTVLVERETERD